MTNGAALCEALPWDSAFFGVSIARVVTSGLDLRTCAEILEWCRTKRIDCLYFLCPLDDPGTQRQLTEVGFELVGIKVTLVRPAAAGAGEIRSLTRLATVDDIPELRQIALSSHRDTRFHADRHFDPSRCDELYATWIEKSVTGYANYVIVAERSGTTIGYLTLNINLWGAGRTASIGLFAVDERWRNRGVGRDLLRGAAQLVASEGASETSVVAAGRNVAALRLYKSEGFQTTDVSLWYHRWFRERSR